MVFKVELNQICKQGMEMEEWLAKIKHLSDQLSLAEALVPLEDLIMHTLSGLETKNNTFVFGLNLQSRLIWEELEYELSTFES